MSGTMKTVSVLGSTGSIGTQTIELLLANPDLYQVQALVAGSNVALLAQQAIALRAKLAVVADPSCHAALVQALAGAGIEVASGTQAVIEAGARPADWTMCAIMGAAGLHSTLAAIERGQSVALANKEALVCAGDVMLRAVAAAGATLLPVDSEHNAIFQAMADGNRVSVDRIILTASGGPFRTASLDEMRAAPPEAALRHPVIHPQSTVHGLVCYSDGSVLAQLGSPDMRVPIAHTLAWPKRIATAAPRLDLAALGRLEFSEPDPIRFPALRLARQALQEGGGVPTLMSAANEVAVEAFLQRQIGFLDIAAVVEQVMLEMGRLEAPSLEAVIEIDRTAREKARAFCSTRQPFAA